MYTTISAQRLSIGSVYKLWLIGLGSAMAPFGVLCGVLAMFEFNTVTLNGQPLHGVAGLVVGSLLGFVLAFMFTVFLGTTAILGLWLYSKFRPITLKVKIPFENTQEEKQIPLDFRES